VVRERPRDNTLVGWFQFFGLEIGRQIFQMLVGYVWARAPGL